LATPTFFEGGQKKKKREELAKKFEELAKSESRIFHWP